MQFSDNQKSIIKARIIDKWGARHIAKNQGWNWTLVQYYVQM